MKRVIFSLAALLSKFRISYSDVIVIPDIMKKAQTSTKIEFEAMIQNFRVRDDEINDSNRKLLLMKGGVHYLREAFLVVFRPSPPCHLARCREI